MPKALFAVPSASVRRLPLPLLAVLFLLAASAPLIAQDDITTENATSGYNGVFITGPASNPLSFLNGAAGRTTAKRAPYDFHDFAPATYLDENLPRWMDLQVEERFRGEAYDDSNFKRGVDDSYLLNRFRLQIDLHTRSWLRVTAQVQDARAGYQTPPLGPPNTVRWDLKLAYAEIGAPESRWFSLRVGRQLDQLQQHHHCRLPVAQPGPILRCGGAEPECATRARGDLRRLGRGAAGLWGEPTSGRQQYLRSLRANR